jgi:hypothetical protein
MVWLAWREWRHKSAEWRKGSRSSTNGCVEVTFVGRYVTVQNARTGKGRAAVHGL